MRNARRKPVGSLVGSPSVSRALALVAGVGCKRAPEPVMCSTRRARCSGRPRRFPPPTRTTSTTWTAAVALTPDEVKGRNMWIVWTGGNDRFWDEHDAQAASARSIC